MTCAVIESLDGQLKHYTNVIKANIRLANRQSPKPSARLTLIDESEVIVENSMSVKLVGDDWLGRNLLSLNV